MNKSIFLLLFLLIQFLQAEENLKKVTLQLSWFNQFQFAGYYMAKEKGFYKELGLDVDIKPFQFDLDIPTAVNDGTVDFAIGRETLILEKASGKNIVALFALFQSSPLILLSTKESGIKKMSDFNNKKIMTTIDDASEVSLKAMITSNKISLEHLKFLKHTHNIDDLINKKTDIISAYISKTPFILEQKGIAYNIFSSKDYGFDMYSDLLYTNQKLIVADPQTAIKFKKASLKGWKYAYNNINEATNIILKKYNTQNLSKEELIYEAKELKKLSYLNNIELGTIKLNKMQRIYDLYNLMGLLPHKIDINDFIFNDASFYTNLTKKEKEFIKQNPIITMGEQEAFKPINFYNSIGVHDGILHDYMKIISEKTGLRFVSVIDEKDNLLNKLKNKNINIVGISSGLQSKQILHTDSYFELHKTAFKLNNTNTQNINTIGILNHLSQMNTISDTYSQATIIEFGSVDEAVTNLLEKKIDLIYISEEILLTYIQDNHINSIEYASNTIPSTIIPLAFALDEDSVTLHSILSKAFKHITHSQHESIRNKWIPVMIEKKYDWSLLWQILAFLFVIIGMVIYKQISMHTLNNKLKIANIKLKELSELDFLTKLYNRRYFEDTIEQVLQIDTKEKNTTSLVMFDIDDFKKINDTYGHHVGDKVLIDLALNLKKFSRRSDIIARVGGEEFLILLPNTSLENAKKHCENLRKMIENLKIKDGEHNISFTVSMGLTHFKDDDTLDSVLLRTDNSLYQVKRSGKNSLMVN
jgi:diguanylate cyclase (GGDEF)-like protein